MRKEVQYVLKSNFQFKTLSVLTKELSLLLVSQLRWTSIVFFFLVSFMGFFLILLANMTCVALDSILITEEIEKGVKFVQYLLLIFSPVVCLLQSFVDLRTTNECVKSCLCEIV